MRAAWLACCAIGLGSIAHAQELTFDDALARAVEGPSIQARRDATQAAGRLVGPADQLPDPELVLGLENVPIEGRDAYRLDRDFMTMQSVGLMQVVPSDAERGARRSVAQSAAARADAALSVARLEARLGAARAWIGAYYANRRVTALQGLEAEARTAIESARARLAAGGSGIDDAISAEIGAASLADRVDEAEASLLAAQADLIRWIGPESRGRVADTVPNLHVDAATLRASLAAHPRLVAFAAEYRAAEADLSMAQAERAPDWSWSLMVQHRDRDFGDMASLEVRIGLPLFQNERQGPVVDARRADQARVANEWAAAHREYEAELEAALAQYAAAERSVVRTRDTRLPLARRRAQAARGAFAAGTMSVADLFVARREAIEAELDLIDLEERGALLGAVLTLQFAEQTP